MSHWLKISTVFIIGQLFVTSMDVSLEKHCQRLLQFCWLSIKNLIGKRVKLHHQIGPGIYYTDVIKQTKWFSSGTHNSSHLFPQNILKDKKNFKKKVKKFTPHLIKRIGWKMRPLMHQLLHNPLLIMTSKTTGNMLKAPRWKNERM